MKRAIAIAALVASPALAQGSFEIQLPWMFERAAYEMTPLDTHRLPIGPHRSGLLPATIVRGSIERIALQVDTGASTLEILDAISAGLEEKGFSEIFQCASRECGGFNFRTRLEIFPPPEMFVDLGNFRFLAARRDDGGGHVGIIVSRSIQTGFVQITSISDAPVTDVPASSGNSSRVRHGAGILPLAADLVINGYAVLEGLEFKTGSTSLGDADFPELQALAMFLLERPDARVLLVGHTDDEGSLESNLELSRQRAQSVMTRLIDKHGVDPGQLHAEGVGFLAPRSANRIPEGRMLNRRVEALLQSSR